MGNNEAILVTGGAGFIGSCFIRNLLTGPNYCERSPNFEKKIHRVVNLDKLTYASNLNSLDCVADDPRYKLIAGDIADQQIVGQIFRELQPSCVVNFAAETHVDRSIEVPKNFVETNAWGTFRLLEYTLSYWKSLEPDAQSDFRFVNISTDEVYGSLGSTGQFIEASPYQPNSPYSASKAAADHFVRAFYKTYGLPVITTHSSNNFGPWQYHEKLIPLVIRHALSGKKIPVFGDGKNVRDWIFVDDHCEALMAVLAKGRIGQTYNIGGKSEKSNLEVIKFICDFLDESDIKLPISPCSSLIQFVSDRPGHDFRYAVDISKMQNQLNWAPRVDFETGMKSTIQWYLEHPEFFADAS